MRGPYTPGQLVMYWIRRHRTSRQETGRWHGPAQVIHQESPSAVWLSHAERLFKCAPESIRPASLREWSSVHGSSQIWVPELPTVEETQRAPATPAESLEYEASIAPSEGIFRNPPSQLATPHSSTQPESETFPEPSHEFPASLPTENENQNSPEAVPDEPIDLDPEESNPHAAATDAMPILQCSSVAEDSDGDTLYDWTILQSNHSGHAVLLAEDGLPMLDTPLACDEQQCFALSIDLSESDVLKWSAAEKPEEMAWVASVGKRAKAEVCEKLDTRRENTV